LLALKSKVFFITNQQQQSLEALQDIKKMMDRSSRFISLSGWSGIMKQKFILQLLKIVLYGSC
jgi:hypothetical protein